MGLRRQAREAALQAIYLADVSSLSPQEAFDVVKGGLKGLDAGSETFIKDLLEGTLRHRPELDGRIQAVAANWELGRMAAVDRNLLRMAAYELLHRGDAPVGVVTDEALEIAKRFSAAESFRFINGILDKLKP